MKFIQLALTALTLVTALSSFAGEEAYLDFRVDASALERGQDQMSFEWQGPDQFRSTQMAVTDLVNINKSHPENLHMVNSKIAMISSRPLNDFAVESISTQKMVKDLLRSVSVIPKGGHVYDVTNKVKAYGISFKVSFKLAIKEVKPNAHIAKYFRDQASLFEGTGNERFVSLDMTNFSQLMYRNYSIIYAKELKDGRTLIVASTVSGFNLKKANSYFNYPPISRTDSTMVGNIRSQTLHMLKEMKN
ncbi:MAG: hypothetical protein ACOVP4_08220 [Bacteriovoracaceae bacterium]